jgi:hypothetical protein
MNQKVHDADGLWDLRRRPKAGERDVLIEAGSMHAFFEAAAPGAIADEKETDAREGLDETRGDVQEIVVSRRRPPAPAAR